MADQEKDVLDFINDETAELIAKEVIDIFLKLADEDTLEYDFVIEKETGKVKDDEANTTFSFDAEEDTTLDQFKKSLFQRNLSHDENKQVEEFLSKISAILTANYHSSLEEKIRSVVMSGHKPAKIPMEKIVVANMELADISEVPVFSRHTLRIGKMPGSNVDTEAVLLRLSILHEEDESRKASEIFAEHKDEEVFEGVADIIDGKRYLYDSTLSIFVDYSFSDEYIGLGEEYREAVAEKDEEKLADITRRIKEFE